MTVKREDDPFTYTRAEMRAIKSQFFWLGLTIGVLVSMGMAYIAGWYVVTQG